MVKKFHATDTGRDDTVGKDHMGGTADEDSVLLTAIITEVWASDLIMI